jgi:hypothetical protein
MEFLACLGRGRASLCRLFACVALLPPMVCAAASTDDDKTMVPPAVSTSVEGTVRHPDPPGQLPPTRLHPNAAAGLVLQYGGTPIDVTTYHFDNLRTGWNKAETDLTQATVKSSKFGLLQTIAVDGNVLAQPLLVSGYQLPDGSVHDVLLVVTEHNSAYAFDARTYAQLWQVNFGPPQQAAELGCGSVNPEYGVSATPVIVRTAVNKASVYLVAATEPVSRQFQTSLHKLNLSTGKDQAPPVEIAASATMSDGSTINFSQGGQWIRAGLAYAGGSIYLAATSHCDFNSGTIAGWLLRYDTELQQQKVFTTIDTPATLELAAIWMSGFAPAIDTDGSVFAVTGNGNFARGGKDWGESVIKLPRTLTKVQDFFTPATYDFLNTSDLDFGSGGVMLLPVQAGQLAPPLAVAMGKDGTLYLLDRTNLGKKKDNDDGALQATRVANTGHGVWGGPAYFEGPSGGVVFYQLTSATLAAYALSTGAVPSLTETARGTTVAGFGGSLPIVSSNGRTAGTGVVWVIRRGSTLQLEAYDAEHLGAPIFAASAGAWPKGNPFITPLEANGRVYVPSSGSVMVFGLTP